MVMNYSVTKEPSEYALRHCHIVQINGESYVMTQ